MSYTPYYPEWHDAVFGENNAVITPTDTPLVAAAATVWDQAHASADTRITSLQGSLDAKMPGSGTTAPFLILTSTSIEAARGSNASQAIQAFLNAAGQGTVIYWPSGVYRAIGLTPLSGQRWIGPGVIQRVANSTASIIAASDLADFTIDGLTIDGSKTAATATSNSGMFITRGTRVKVQNCTFRNMPTNNPALEFRASIDGYIAGNSFTNVGYGVIVALAAGSSDACRANTITGNRFNGVDLNPVFVTENVGSAATTVLGTVYDTVVTNNTIQNWHDAGIEIGSGCVRSVVSGNILDNGGNTGVLVRDNTDCVVSNNIISTLTDGTTAGISCIALNGPTTNLTLSDNQVRGAVTGIQIGQVSGLQINGGSVRSCTANGIDLYQADQFAVSGVHVRGNGQHGIAVGVYQTTSSSQGSITGCTIMDNSTDPAAVNARDGISVVGPASSDLAITGNRIGDSRAAAGKTQRYGINVLGTGNNRYVITGNNLLGNATGGLNDGGGTTKQVSGNLVPAAA